MPSSTDNIEAMARFICERDFCRRVGIPETELAAGVDRYWHCVAAQIEAGFIDDNGEIVPQGLETGLAAYRDWRSRHPAYTPPPRAKQKEKA